MNRSVRVKFLLATGLAFFTLLSHSQESEPQSLTAARENFEREFVRDLSLVQKKYIGALENYQRQFSKENNLEAAREAGLELRNAKEWATIPPEPGKRKLTNENLILLLEKYEAAIAKPLQAVIDRYVEKLQYLIKGYTSRNEIEASLLADKEIKRVQEKQHLPRNAGAKRYYESLDQEGFREWLFRQEFEFAGIAAGVTKVTIERDKLNYHPMNDELAKGYSYTISGNRGVSIADDHFHMEFSKDLQTGTFTSTRGEYEITVKQQSLFDQTNDSDSGTFRP